MNIYEMQWRGEKEKQHYGVNLGIWKKKKGNQVKRYNQIK